MQLKNTKADTIFVYEKSCLSLVPLTLNTPHVSKPRKIKGEKNLIMIQHFPQPKKPRHKRIKLTQK